MSPSKSRSRVATIRGAGAAVAAARVVSLLAAVVQLPVLTRTLPAAEYGAIAVIMSLSIYFSLVAAEPATLAFQRHPGLPHERGNYAYALSKILPAAALAGLIVVVVGLISGEMESALGVVAWGLSLALARYTATAWLMWHRSWSYALNLMASTLARTAVLVGLVLAGFSGPVALILAGLASAAVSLLLSPRASFRRRNLPTRPWPRALGYFLAAASLGVTILSSANVILVERRVGAASAASFAAMAQLALLTSGAVASTLLTVIYPYLRRQWDDGEQDKVIRLLRVTQLLMVIIAGASVVTLTVFDGYIAGIVVNRSLVDIPTLSVLVIAAVLGAIGQTSGWLLQFRLEARSLAIRTAVASAIALALLVALIWGAPIDPARGAAIATAVGFFVYAAMLRGRAALREPFVTVLFLALLGMALAAPFVPLPVTTYAAAALGTVAMIAVVLSQRKTT